MPALRRSKCGEHDIRAMCMNMTPEIIIGGQILKSYEEGLVGSTVGAGTHQGNIPINILPASELIT